MDFNRWWSEIGCDLWPDVDTEVARGVARIAWREATRAKLVQDEDRFTAFWKLYPKRVAKPSAQKAWRRLSDSDQLDVLTFLPRAEWPDSKQYIPYPSTWLNQRRWEDEVDIDDDGDSEDFVL